MKITKNTKILLCAALALILLGSILAGVFNSGNGAVKVSRIKFDGSTCRRTLRLPTRNQP